MSEVKEVKLISEFYSYQNTKLIDIIPCDWIDFFKNIDLEKIDCKLKSDKRVIFPRIENIFGIFKWLKIEEINVIILGQDPYHGKDQAIGMSFAVGNGKISPSLKNIYKEIKMEYKKPMNEKNTLLMEWVGQGVFLYNTALTVIEKNPKSHSKIWTDFSIEFVKWSVKYGKNIIYMLWGGDAQKFGKYIPSEQIIKCSHPSPLGANSGAIPFIGSNCFKKCNLKLLKFKKKEINWIVE